MADRRLSSIPLIICCVASCAAAPISLSAQSPPLATTARPSAPPTATRPAGDNRLDRIAEIVANAVDQKHGGEKYRAYSAMQCDIALSSGDVAYEGRLSFQINGQSARLDLKDGSAIVFDGQTCWVSGNAVPDEVALKRLLALRRLLASPFIGRERDVKISGYRATMVIGSDADSYKVQWAAIGDEQPVELVAYAGVRTRMLSAIGCDALPSLLGLPDGEHAAKGIVFSDTQSVEGGMIPTTWTLYEWSNAAGVAGDAKGTIKISNAKYARGDEVNFAAPEGARIASALAKP